MLAKLLTVVGRGIVDSTMSDRSEQFWADLERAAKVAGVGWLPVRFKGDLDGKYPADLHITDGSHELQLSPQAVAAWDEVDAATVAGLAGPAWKQNFEQHKGSKSLGMWQACVYLYGPLHNPKWRQQSYNPLVEFKITAHDASKFSAGIADDAEWISLSDLAEILAEHSESPGRSAPDEDERIRRALDTLRALMVRAPSNPDYAKIIEARTSVLAKYKELFRWERIPQLEEEDIRSFLIFKNNQHWAGLQRLGPAIARDMFALREALGVLFDESKPLDERVDYANSRVPKLAQAVITPLLLVSNPERYGVWNRISQAGLIRLGLLPAVSRRATLGERYVAINDVLLHLARELKCDQWTLDALWWAFETPSSDDLPETPPPRVWIEITEVQHGHGGPGWELGTCLWSPTRNSTGARKYEVMRLPRPGDLVLHFVAPVDSRQRRIWGMSYVALDVVERNDEPPSAGKWSKRGHYYRVALDRFHQFENMRSVETLVERNRDLLREEAEREEAYPFSKYGVSTRLAQGRYLARCTPKLYEAIRDVMKEGSGTAGTVETDLAAVTLDFAGVLRDANVAFGDRHDELVRTFVCSLAAKRFVILTGLSGSGKTQLALKFGQWLGEKRYEVVAVRPDWTGPESLLGYEDALLPPSPDGRRAWCVPQTLELLLRAARDPGTPYLLVLDEMNLAHVERYFADVLSGIESEEAVLPDLRDEDGAWRSAKRGLRLPFPENVFIVGTVNVDETTYLFSPKVLDRANVIEFRVGTDELSADPATARKPLPARAGSASLVSGFLEVSTDDEWQLDHAPDFLDGFVERLRLLHRMLCETQDEFGHRTFYEGIRLAALLGHAGDVSLEEALDIFVLQKVLPRLHGSRRRLEPVLRKLSAFCIDPERGHLGETTGSSSANAILFRSFAKVRRMFNALKVNQFASFSD